MQHNCFPERVDRSAGELSGRGERHTGWQGIIPVFHDEGGISIEETDLPDTAGIAAVRLPAAGCFGGRRAG